MFNIIPNYLQHDGGNKFYETVMIEDSRGPTMLIKRWGKITDAHGGGQTKVERGTQVALHESRRKIIDEKRKVRSGGRYVDTLTTYGFHSGGAAAGVDESRLRALLGHYNDASVRVAIRLHFGLDDGDVDDIVKATGEDFIVEGDAPAAEVDRGESWGSW